MSAAVNGATVVVYCEYCREHTAHVPAESYREDAAYYCSDNCREWHRRNINLGSAFESPAAHREYQAALENSQIAAHIAAGIHARMEGGAR